MIETLIGHRYRIKALIGEGGMASVYAALDEKLERKVAIKIMHPHLARNQDIRERFLLEARTVSGLDHPNILRVYDFSGLDSEQLWIVMEILHGEDLSEYVKRFPRNRLQFIVAALVTREICRALNEAHKLNVVHRDIKPENIMMLNNGHIKLMDFGIAKVHRANATQTGIFMGSPSYMSPEQIRGTDVDARADIYSLAVLFYEIVTGQLPFVGKSTAEVINRIMVGRYSAPNLLITELPSPLNNIIVRGMAHHKDERFQNVTEMSLALDNFLTSVNFRESRLELEEFTLNRTKFEERIAEVLTVPPTALNALPPEIISPTFNSKVTRYQASYEQNPLDSSTVMLSDDSLPTLPPDPKAMAPQIPVELPKKPDESKVPQNSAPMQAKAPRSQQTSQPPQSQSQSPSKNQKQGTNFPSPMRNATQAPRTPGRSTQHKAVYREFQEDEKKSKNYLGLVIGIASIAAALLFFFVMSDKNASKPPKLPPRVTETQKPKKRIEKEAEAPTTPAPQPEAVEPKPNDESTTSETPAPTPTPELSPNNPVPTPATPSVVTNPIPNQSPKAQTQKPKPQVPKSTPVRPQPNKVTTEIKPDVKVPTPTPPKEVNLASIPQDKTPEDKIPEKPSLPPEKDKPREKEKDKPSATGPGLLRLAALPAAEVYLDGKMYGTTNDKQFGSQGIKLDPGTYMLRLKRKGYKTEEQAIQIKPGEMRQISVTLNKLADFVELSIRVNKLPAIIVIEDVKGRGKREMPMSKHSQQFNLKPGTYKVMVSHENESINRTMELTEENKAITFNADFK